MRPRHVQRRLFRPLLEALEGRTLLSVCVVDRPTDAGEGKDMRGDLRYCITEATSGEDTITFEVEGTINLTRALPSLSQSVSIEGPGADLLTVRRHSGGAYRIFHVAPGSTTVSISGLTITNGSGSGPGSGILNNNATRLTISNCTIIANTTVGPDGNGGAGIWSNGPLTINNSTIWG